MSSEQQKLMWRKASSKYRKTKKGLLNGRKFVLAHKKRYPDKMAARVLVARAVNKGTLIRPSVCQEDSSECSTGGIVGHHPDYSKPLEVEWLCRFHHGRRHYES